MISCKDLAEKILLFKDGGLSEEETEFVRKHLHVCPPCVDLFKTYEEVVDVLDRLKPVKMPEGFLERMKQKMAERGDIQMEGDPGECPDCPE